MKQFRNGFGVAYRELEQTATDLKTLLEKGEVRLSMEEIHWRYEAIKEIRKQLSRIWLTLEDFEGIAPPPVRIEPLDPELEVLE